MDSSEENYESLPDISGTEKKGPRVLKKMLKYKDRSKLRWDSRHSCVQLATSDDLYDAENTANTLLCVQSKALLSLCSKHQIDLIACFLRCSDKSIRREAIKHLERELLNIQIFSKTFSLLTKTETELFEVITHYLDQWRVLSKDNEHFFTKLVRLYCMVIGTLAFVSLKRDKHTDFETLVKDLKKRKAPRIKKNKELMDLNFQLKQIDEYLNIKLRSYQKILTAVDTSDAESLSKTSAKSFTVVHFLSLKIFTSPSMDLLTTLNEYVRSIPLTASASKQDALLPDLLTNAVLHFLLQYLTEGKLPVADVQAYYQSMIAMLPTKHKATLQTIDVLMFLKNAGARSQVIEIFLGHPEYNYGSDIVKTNLKIIESLLSVATPTLQTPGEHPYAREWRQCSGKFGNSDIVLNVYIPDQENHKKDIYVDASASVHSPLNEVSLLKEFNFPKIIQVLAFSLTKLPYFYITENHLLGNLQLELKNKSINMDPFHPSQLRIFVVDAIETIKFLHGHNIVHRDLTASSYFITEDRRHIKLANLCLATRQDKREYMERHKGKSLPRRWSAPESISDLMFSKESDIWMFGCLMYEILSHGCLPHSDVRLHDKKLLNLIVEGRKMLSHENCIPERLFGIMKDCIQTDANLRPGSISLEDQLKAAVDEIGPIHLPPGVIFPDLLRERLPSTDLKRGLPVDRKKEDELDRRPTSRVFRELPCPPTELYEEELYLDDCNNSSYERVFDVSSLPTFPTTENTVPEIIHSHLLELEKEKLPEIPKFTLDRNCSAYVIRFDLPDDVVNLAFMYRTLRGDFKERMLTILAYTANAISQLHQKNWIHGKLDTMHIWISGRCHQEILFSNIRHMTKIETPGQAVTFDQKMFNKDTRSAPELRQHGKLSCASDVFSFGFVMWDVSQSIYGTKKGKRAEDMLPEEDLYSHFSTACQGEIIPSPDNCPSNLYNIMKSCWHRDPTKRPTVKDISEQILDLITSDVEDPYANETIVEPTSDVEDPYANETIVEPDAEDESDNTYEPMWNHILCHANYCSADEIRNSVSSSKDCDDLRPLPPSPQRRPLPPPRLQRCPLPLPSSQRRPLPPPRLQSPPPSLPLQSPPPSPPLQSPPPIPSSQSPPPIPSSQRPILRRNYSPNRRKNDK